MKAEVLKLELLGNTNLVLVTVCCAVCLLKQLFSFPHFPWLSPVAASCLTHHKEQLWGQDSLPLLPLHADFGGCVGTVRAGQHLSWVFVLPHACFSPLRYILNLYSQDHSLNLLRLGICTYFTVLCWGWPTEHQMLLCKTLLPWVVSRRTLRFVREAMCCSLWMKLREACPRILCWIVKRL